MASLRRVAGELDIAERTLRRAANQGLVRAEKVSPRRVEVTLREENYLRGHWPLLSDLLAGLRTERMVRLAVLFGSTATGDDSPRSDIDVLVTLREPTPSDAARVAERLSVHVGRDVQLVHRSDAERAPGLMTDILEHGRVLADRDSEWNALISAKDRWLTLASGDQRLSFPPGLDVDGSFTS